MKINQIKVYKVSLSFKMDFSHALAKGASADNIVVEIIADEGKIKGYGEGTPRRYVTGESQHEAVDYLREIVHENTFPQELRDVSDIWKYVDGLPDEKNYNPAICALETALLDALGQKQQRNIADFFPHDFFISKIYYGGAIPLGNQQKLIELCRLIIKTKINKIKLKVGKDFKKNQAALEVISHEFGDAYDLKIDVNCAWNEELALKHIPLLRKYRVKVVEQPMMPDDPSIAGFAEALKKYGIFLMADESACSFEEVEKIVEEGYFNMINIRLSTLGGFRKSLKVIDYLRKEGLFFQIGCHLGESGILSAAGRILSLLCKDSLYYDGSYDDLLLKQNITKENVSFGLGGEAGPLKGSGLGVTINEQSLNQLTTEPVHVIKR
jgi:L-alanine-DL-glutamate epimerase-like enolase superfamily enzyme